jgi:ankyrin repeat protein
MAARSLEIFTTLLDHGANPTAVDSSGWSVLMHQSRAEGFDKVLRLLQDPRVQAALDVQNDWRYGTPSGLRIFL